LGRRPHVPGVDAQSLQHRLRGPGQLLHEVHDDEFLVQPKEVEEPAVGKLVDARLIAAEVDGNAVGLAVVERPQQPFSGGHGGAPGPYLSEAT
jgi:hypothetical protein